MIVSRLASPSGLFEKLTRVLAFLLLYVMLAACQSNPTALKADFAFVGVSVIDVRNGDIATDQIVLIEDGVITARGGFDSILVPTGVRTVFARGQYLLPGFWDSHVHAFANTEDAMQRTLPLFLAHGVTQIRDLGTTLTNLEHVRLRLAESPNATVPLWQSTGPLLDSVPLPWYGDLQTIVSADTELSDLVNSLEARDITQLKTYTNLDPDLYGRLANIASQRGLTLVGHIPRNVSLREVATAPHLTIEHLDILSTHSCATTDRNWLDDSIKARFQQGHEAYFALMTDYWAQVDWADCRPALSAIGDRGGYWTPTLLMESTDASMVDQDALQFLDHDARAYCESLLADVKSTQPQTQHAAYRGLKDALDQVRASGIRILAGSDSPNGCLVPGASLSWELHRLVDFGLTELEALQSATLHPSLAFRGRAPLVEAGQPANLVLLRANPLDDIQAVKAVTGVYVEGHWLGQDDIRAIKHRAVEFIGQQADSQPADGEQ